MMGRASIYRSKKGIDVDESHIPVGIVGCLLVLMWLASVMEWIAARRENRARLRAIDARMAAVDAALKETEASLDRMDKAADAVVAARPELLHPRGQPDRKNGR
jgi:hypothetical protein